MEFTLRYGLTRKINIHHIQVFATISAIILGLFLPKYWIEGAIIPIAFSFIILGIPHGAADFFIFQSFMKEKKGIKSVYAFSVYYVITMLLYLLLWWVSPVAAFLVFIAISIYHFGESNWSNDKNIYGWRKTLISLIWGSAILAVPVVLHFDEASVIIYEITGTEFYLSSEYQAAIIFLMVFFNLVLLTYLLDYELISRRKFEFEIGNFLLLLCLFFTTPLLIGFSIYFIFWHSLCAMRDQAKELKLFEQPKQLKEYLKQVSVVTIVSISFLALMYVAFDGQMDKGYNLGILFFFIAIITVPHAIFMHLLLRK